MFAPRARYTIALPGGRRIDLGSRTFVMGVLNVTPDSFAESTRLVSNGVLDLSHAVDDALRMEEEGADIIDVGGESTRPGAEPLPPAEESARVIPVVRALAPRLKVPISIDTYKAAVAGAALAEGAAIVNDISGLRYDPALGAAVAAAGAAMILMHTRGRSKTMYEHARYTELIAEIAGELRESAAAAAACGIAAERLILDPGIGFAKRPEHSYGVLARLSELAELVDRPLLVGPSRKSFMRDALDGRAAAERDWGTAAAVTAAVLGGAHIVRVHAVERMAQVVRVADEIRRHGETASDHATEQIRAE